MARTVMDVLYARSEGWLFNTLVKTYIKRGPSIYLSILNAARRMGECTGKQLCFKCDFMYYCSIRFEYWYEHFVVKCHIFSTELNT